MRLLPPVISVVTLAAVLGGVALVGDRPGAGDGPVRARTAAGPATGPASPVRSTELALAGRLERTAGTDARTRRLDVATYRLLAVTWQGRVTPDVEVRTRTDRHWGDWHALEPLADLGGEGTGVRGSELLWVDRADGVQARVTGRSARALTLVLIDPGRLATDVARTPGVSRASRRTSPTGTVAATGGAPRPPLHSRTKWGANEDWRNGGPSYNTTIKQVHVHHTATGNRYSRDDVPALIRGMYRYHTHNLGWSDIGYNFLVDRFGRTWIGRAGGYDRPVRGAHTLGFNYNSVGVAVIGSFQGTAPSEAAVTAVVRLSAWKLDLYGRDPASRKWVRSEGSDLYPAGRWARLPTIDGHRDTNQTACPGAGLYRLLPAIRDRAQRRVDRY